MEDISAPAVVRSSIDKMEKGGTVGRGGDDTLGSNSTISYRYLTFETPLPSPSTPDIIPPPDLSRYTNPQTWSPAVKNVHLALSCIATFLTAYSAGSYSPPSRLMAADLGASHTEVLLGITTFCAGFSLAPMVLAPVSEIWGRYYVFAVAGVVLVAFQIACPLVPNLAGLLAARFLVGSGASVFSSVVGGVLADLWAREERNTPMALFSGFVLGGTGAGPLVAGGIMFSMGETTAAWKWTFWHQVISTGILLVSLLVFFRETRATVLLSRKAAILNKWYEQLETAGVYGVWIRGGEEVGARTSVSESETSGLDDVETAAAEAVPVLRRVRWKVQADEERASLATMMTTSIIRPFHLLCTEPIVFFFSLWAAFGWSILYLAFAVVPYLYGDDYNAACRTYIALIVGGAVATAVSIWQEDLLHHREWRVETATSDAKVWVFLRRHFPAESPESRLYLTAISSMFLPAGLFGAFMAQRDELGGGDGATSLAVGLGFACWGIYSIYLASFNYLADSYQIYASSALAANSFCRNVLGGALPVVTAPMFDGLGLKGAGGLLAGIATVLSVTPWVLIFWGEQIRSRSRMALLLRK